ncbi:MAG TPA: metalloregulator ArsR/SmtB family transcription factor [Terriglobales bacterium]|nr:metalloregulator ArsR/SmtB family transcription factor [Terriglobales bacterium]
MKALSALADPTRRQIVEMLTGGELSAGDIASRFRISRPAVSQHLKVLRESGLVTVRGAAQRRIYALEASGLDELEAWLARYRRFWSARLDALDQRLQKEAGAHEHE